MRGKCWPVPSASHCVCWIWGWARRFISRLHTAMAKANPAWILGCCCHWGLNQMVGRGEIFLAGSRHCPNELTSPLCPGRYRDCLPHSCSDTIRQQIIFILPKWNLFLKVITRVAVIKGDWESCWWKQPSTVCMTQGWCRLGRRWRRSRSTSCGLLFRTSKSPGICSHC